MKKFLTTIWPVIILLVINVSLCIYIAANRKESISHDKYLHEIDSLKSKILTNEQIYKNAINHPVLFGREWDSLRTAFEEQTELSRFRDSLEHALSKKHPNK